MALPAPSVVAPCQNLHQLPRGDDRNIGAGYAMAMAAMGAAVLYFVVQFVGILLLSAGVGSASSGLFLGFAVIGSLTGAGTVAGVVAPSRSSPASSRGASFHPRYRLTVR